MDMAYTQKLELAERGYTVLRNAVPKVKLEQALRAINHSVGEGIPKEEILFARSQSYCQELRDKPVIKDLINKTPVFDLVESAMGKGKLKPAGGGQIALRFPQLHDGPLPTLRGHLDGIPTEHNGVPTDGKYHNFSALAVVLLSELNGPFAGNFTVWPGSHRQVEAYYRQHGTEAFLKEGMPKLDLGEPVQLVGQPGDVVLTHYAVVHTATPNYSPHVRYASIYRLNHVRRVDSGFGDILTDLWIEWDGIREILKDKKDAAVVGAYV